MSNLFASLDRVSSNLPSTGCPVGNIALGRRFTYNEQANLPAVKGICQGALLAYNRRLATLGARQVSAFGEVE